MKFGGTSVGDANCIGRAAAIVQTTAAQRPVVAVVSAMSGVTNRLVAASQKAEQGEQDFISQLIAELHTQHITALEALTFDGTTHLFYEAPHRIVETLEDVEAVMRHRPIVVARELTKLYEEFLRGSAAEIRAQLAGRPSVKGEITLLIGRGEKSEAPSETTAEDEVHALEGLKMDWENRTRLQYVSGALHRMWAR